MTFIKYCHSQKIGKSNYLKGFVGKKIKGSKQDKTKFSCIGQKSKMELDKD
jgi:hypothetical protein